MGYIKTIRRETGLIEHICKHEIGHPVYASADWIARFYHKEDSEFSLEETRDAWLVHGCDGCCNSAEWQLQSLKESVEIANQIIVDHKRALRETREKLDKALSV